MISHLARNTVAEEEQAIEESSVIGI